MPSTLTAIFGFSFLLAIGAVVSPGPVSTAIVSQSPRRGWLVGPLIATGHIFLELVIVVLIAFGLSSGMAAPAIQTGIALLGGSLLAWMGITMLADITRGKARLPNADTATDALSEGQMIGLGMLTTLSNPFWYAWWMTVAAGYLSQAQGLGGSAVAAFYLGHISADYAWDTILSAIVGGGRRWITNSVYAWIVGLSGVFLIYLGIQFLHHGYANLSG